MKRVPSFSSRPNFPEGLQILVVDSEPCARHAVDSQLQELGYVVVTCQCCGEAVEQLTTSSQRFDIVLAEAQALQGGYEKFQAAVSGLPLVLMSESTSADEVMRGIQIGAVDFLEKPVSTLKLKNIWQHVVRKMMEDLGAPSKTSSCDKFDRTAAPEQSCGTKKSDSMPTCPKTPSPAASGGDAGSIATSNSKATEGEMSSSEARDAMPTVELSDGKSPSKCGSSTNGKSKVKKRPKEPYSSAAGCRPPLAVKSQSYAGVPQFGNVMMLNGWGPTAPCVLGTPMAPGSTPSSMFPNMLPVPYPAQLPVQGGAYPITTPAVMPGLPGMPTFPVLQQGCHYQGMYSEGLVNQNCTQPVELRLGDVQPDKAPLGLQLRKSDSLVNLINEQLNQAY